MFSASEKVTKSTFSHRFRFFILGLTCLCLTSIGSNMIALNFTIICMTPALNSTVRTDAHPNVPTYHYTQNEKQMLNMVVGVGSVIATFPFIWLYTHYGARYVFLIAGLMSFASTVVIPIVASMDLWYFYAARFMQGVSYAGNFACIGVVCVAWAPLKENAIFLAILTSFTPMSSLLTNPIAGILCETVGWPSVFYFHALAGVILFILWNVFYDDKPITHKFVSIKELDVIHKDKSHAHIKMDSYIPYMEICKNPVILTVWFNALADIGTTIFILMYAPTYFNNILKFGIAETGIYGMLPVFLNVVAKWTSGYFSDTLQYNETAKLISFNCLALVPPGLLLFALGYVPDEWPWVGFWLVVSIECLLGANCGGFYKCGALVSRQYAHFVVAFIQFIKCLTLFMAPGLVAIFVEHDTSREQWRHVFFVLGMVLIIASILFCLVATDRPAEFTKLSRNNKMEKIHSSKVVPA